MINTKRIAEITSIIPSEKDKEFMENFLMNVYGECNNSDSFLETISFFALTNMIESITATIILPHVNEIYYGL